MRCAGSGETCPWLILGARKRTSQKTAKGLLFGRTGRYDLEESSSHLEAESVIFQCILYAKSMGDDTLECPSSSPPLAEFGGKCLNQPHASSSAFPTSPILTVMKRTMINDSSNNIKPCYDRDTTLSLRPRDGFQHLLVQAL